MTTVAILPFYSQQDKRTGEFLLEADVSVQMSVYIAQKLREHGYTVRILEEPSISIPHNNIRQRREYDYEGMATALNRCDLLISFNELTALHARVQFGDRLKILTFNLMMPIGLWEWMKDLQQQSWASSDLVTFLSKAHLDASDYSGPSSIWPMCYDADRIQRSGQIPRQGILFVQRCSESNYTHHREFLQAVRLIRRHEDIPVIFTDPTGYLEYVEGCDADLGTTFAHCVTRFSYYDLLSRCNVAVALMTDDLHGGVAIREAVVSGCKPVLLDCPTYRRMLQDDAWPYFTSLSPAEMAVDILSALHAPYRTFPAVEAESYQAVWPRVLEDIRCLS